MGHGVEEEELKNKMELVKVTILLLDFYFIW